TARAATSCREIGEPAGRRFSAGGLFARAFWAVTSWPELPRMASRPGVGSVTARGNPLGAAPAGAALWAVPAAASRHSGQPHPPQGVVSPGEASLTVEPPGPASTGPVKPRLAHKVL